MQLNNYFKAMLPPPSSRGQITRPVPAKTKVFSILDRARVAMDQSYGSVKIIISSCFFFSK